MLPYARKGFGVKGSGLTPICQYVHASWKLERSCYLAFRPKPIRKSEQEHQTTYVCMQVVQVLHLKPEP